MSMNLLLPSVTGIVLVVDKNRSTVYIKQEDLPSATVVFETAREARRYIRKLRSVRLTTQQASPTEVTEINLTQRTDRKVKL